jgi:hypothetical protein
MAEFLFVFGLHFLIQKSTNYLDSFLFWSFKSSLRGTACRNGLLTTQSNFVDETQ